MEEERESAAEERSDAVYESDGVESISASSCNTGAGLPSAEGGLKPESSESVCLLSDVVDDDGRASPERRVNSCLVSKGTGVCGTISARRGREGRASDFAEESSAELDGYLLGSMFQGSCGNRAPGVPLRA